MNRRRFCRAAAVGAVLFAREPAGGSKAVRLCDADRTLSSGDGTGSPHDDQATVLDRDSAE